MGETDIEMGRCGDSARPRPPTWMSIALGFGLFLAFTANRRSIEAGDVVPATLAAASLARGEGPWIDRYADLVRTKEGRLPGYAEDARGHAVSRYPIGPAIVAAPFVAAQIGVLDLTRPGWERDRKGARRALSRMGKNAAAAIVAMAGVVMLRVLYGMGFGRVALASVLAVTLGSDDLAVASQALWQHGPAELCLAAAMAVAQGRGRARLAVAGACGAMMVACRPTDVVFAGALAVWVARRCGRGERRAFLATAAAGAVALAGYHLWFFDTLTGGYAKIEQMHPWAHGVKGTWTAPFLEGASGTLLSPSHGLLVYCPWVALAVGMLTVTWRRLDPMARGVVVALVPTFVMLSKYSCWWAGHCFGPRFWIDANPAFAILLAAAMDEAIARRRRSFLVAVGVAVAWAMAIQVVGVVCYPSTWHGRPTNADRDHPRLWHWRDSEVTRCLREGPRPPMW